MGIANEQTTSQITHLIELLRDYFALQKDSWSLQGAQVLTRLFSAIILWAILILVGFMVLMFGGFALAFWFGNMLGSNLLGFAIITGCFLLLACIVYFNRTAWIIQPTTRFMISLLGPTVTIPTEDGINLEKERLNQKINEQQEQMKSTASTILAPIPEARNRWESASNLLMNGWNIYRGLQLGLSTVAAIRGIFGGRKRRK